MNVFGMKGSEGGVQPFSFNWLPGASMANLFSLYPSLGDFTSTGSITIPTVQDGPIRVVRYGTLALNHVLTVSNRCRGLVILCDSFSGGAGGGINMTARGAAGQSWWPWYNLTIPQEVAISSKYMSQREVMQYFADNGYFIGDPVVWTQALMMGFAGLPGVAGTLTEGVKILDGSKCGARTPGVGTTSSQYSTARGQTGNAGLQGTGAGGAGSGDNIGYSHGLLTAPGGRGCPWGGGPGAGGNIHMIDYGAWGSDGTYGDPVPSAYGGRGGYGSGSGGGAGNPGGGKTSDAQPGGDGTGGVLVVISRGGFNVASGFVAQADGTKGGDAVTYYCAGSGSGGGFQAWIRGTGTANTQSGTRRCNGGPGGAQGTYAAAGTQPGAPGGVGVVMDLQFSDLGF